MFPDSPGRPGAMLPGIEQLSAGGSNLSKLIYLCVWMSMSQMRGWMCQLQKLPPTNKGYLCLSGVGDLNPSWAWSQAGVRSYCHSQTLLLGCSSSQSLPCPVLLKICWVLVFCPTSPMLQETKLQNWAGEWAAAGTTAVWDLLPPGSSPAPGDSRPVSKEGS